MNNRRGVLQLIAIMMVIAVLVTGITLSALYNATIQQQSARLAETARILARTFEAIARFDFELSPTAVGEDAFAATLSQIESAHAEFEGFGATGELTLAKLENDQIIFLLSHRHHDFGSPQPISMNSTLAEPTRLGLSGKSGTIIGYDYRGVKVLAAYEPVRNLNLSLVVKINLSEIRMPFIKAALIAGGLAFILIVLGAILSIRISNPLIRAIEDNEVKYRTLFESATEGRFLLTDTFIECNERACIIWGCSRDDIIGHTPLEFSPPVQPNGRDSIEAATEIIGAALAGTHQFFYWQHRRKDGVLIDTNLSLKSITIGGVQFLQANMQDITARMQSEKTKQAAFSISELTHSVKSLDQLYPKIHAIVKTLMPAKNFYIASCDTATDTLAIPYFIDQFDDDKITGRKGSGLTEYLVQSGHSLLVNKADYEDLIRRGKIEAIGKPPTSWLGVPLKSKDEIIGAIVVQSYADNEVYRGTDEELLAFVSDQVAMAIGRVLADEALELSERRYRKMVEEAVDAVFITDLEGNFTYVNPMSCKLTGYSEDELLGMNFSRLIESDWRSHVKSFYNDRDDYQKILPKMEFLIVTRDGTEKWVEQEVTLISNNDRVTGVQGVARDISRRKTAEEVLRQSEARFRSVFHSAPDGIVTANDKGMIMAANVSTQELFGYEENELVGQSMTKLLPVEFHLKDDQSLERVAADNMSEIIGHTVELLGKRNDGSEFPLELSLSTWISDEGQFLTGIVRDIADRRLFEQHLNQAEKLAAIGQLAAGVAHEINTPIQYVGDNLRFIADAFSDAGDLLRSYPVLLASFAKNDGDNKLANQLKEKSEKVDFDFLAEEIPMAISESLEGADRVTSIVRAMKEFSHPQGQEKKPEDLNRCLQNTITVARNEWKYVADLETDFDLDLPLVPVFVNEFNQVVLNIILNAAQAISEKNNGESGEKGSIGVQTRLVNGVVEIRIEDSGSGIPDEIQSKVFNPFFTTKPVGSGTGQGLSIAHSIIVEKHRGTLAFESEVDKGTVFIIRLPLVEKEVHI